jgi:DNA repair protein RadA
MASKKKKTSKITALSNESGDASIESEQMSDNAYLSINEDDMPSDELLNEMLEDPDAEKVDSKSIKGKSGKVSKDGTIEEDGLVKKEDEYNGLSSINYDIKDLPGVGATIAKKLEEVGFGTVNSIALTPVNVLMEQAGLGDKTAQKIIQSAREALNIGFKTADQVWERRKSLARISTGCKALDDLLGGGGVETGGLTEFFGEYRTGKTQIMHELCVHVQLNKNEGGLQGKALYIDTEGTFRPERLIQMSESKGLDYREILKNVIYARAYSSDHQIMLVKDALKLVAEKNIKLIIVDSLISHFRSEYIGRGTLANRQQLLNLHLHDLLRLAEMYPELAIVVTNQVQSKPDVFFGDPTKAAGGNIIAHGATVRIYLRKGKGEQRVAKVIDAPNLPESECIFMIAEGGILDVE